ncbi:hypothetical protein ACFQH5_15820 [Halomonas salifodinae]|uniref:Uncharacterized protein n=1 Tax=Halomonas salifodinae TaxID=438745 RepID=A0ABW2F1E6_9GAMM
MQTVSPPPMTRAEAQVALIRHMLTEHGRRQATDLVIIDRHLYRITATEVPPEEVPEATRQFLNREHDHDQ